MIDNTAQRMNNPETALVFLAASMGRDGIGRAVTEQEAAGQEQLIRSRQLPTEIHGDPAEFEALGFALGAPGDSDPLFAPATLPEGWSRQASDHTMWSYLVDDLGRRRVSIFYKAAFYDRSAHMALIDVAGYLRQCVYDRCDVVADDTWATPGALAAAAREEAQVAGRRVASWTAHGNEELASEYATQRDAYAAVAAHFAGE